MSETMDVALYVALRDKALIEMDVDWAQQQSPGTNREVIVIGMHKARIECRNIPEVLRRESMQWLKERDYSRVGFLPWPTDGSLPE